MRTGLHPWCEKDPPLGGSTRPSRPPPAHGGLSVEPGGAGGIRTRDLFHAKETRSHCATAPPATIAIIPAAPARVKGEQARDVPARRLRAPRDALSQRPWGESPVRRVWVAGGRIPGAHSGTRGHGSVGRRPSARAGFPRAQVLTGRWALVAGAVLVVALGCAPRGRSPMPATDPADFMRTGLDVEGNRQRLYIGYAGNGVFLGPGGDAASRPARALGAQSPVAFGDFWQKRSRGALLSLSLTPGPAAADAYWQVLDIDTGQATTCWSFRRSPVSRGECRVESVVTPEGVICWQVRSAGRRMRLSVAVPAVRPEAWEMGGGVAEVAVPEDRARRRATLPARGRPGRAGLHRPGAANPRRRRLQPAAPARFPRHLCRGKAGFP